MSAYEMNEMEKKLVAALRSGKYKQGKSYLRVGDRFCCLGVACDLINALDMDEGRWIPPRNPDECDQDDYMQHDLDGAFEFESGPDTSPEVLVPAMMRWLDWETGAGDLHITQRSGADARLSELNDSGFTFDQIADIIEAGLVKRSGE